MRSHAPGGWRVGSGDRRPQCRSEARGFRRLVERRGPRAGGVSMEKIEDLTYKAQQRQRQGRTLEAIRLFEQALEHRIDLHGPESSSVRKACDNLSDVLNGAALKHLQNEDYDEAKKLLQKAEMLTGPDDLISAVTYNNIACYYRRCVSRARPPPCPSATARFRSPAACWSWPGLLGLYFAGSWRLPACDGILRDRKNKLRTALKYLEKAQRIEMKSRVVANPAGTRLNLCAVLSQLERWLLTCAMCWQPCFDMSIWSLGGGSAQACYAPGSC